MSICHYARRTLMTVCCICLPWMAQAEQIEAIKGARTIDAFEALTMFEKGATFIDVRDQFEFQLGHIRSAVHLDLKRDFNDLYLIETLDKDIPIVIYCNSAHCYRSAVATFLAVAWGYENVHYFKDGYFTWLALDLPVVMGYSQDNLARQDSADSPWRVKMKDALEQVQLARNQGVSDIRGPTIRSLAQ